MIDPRTPVLIGAGQLSNHVERGAAPLEPADMISEAARRAASDAGAPGALAALDAVRIVALFSWRYRDPGLAVAERLGASPTDTAVSPIGGNWPQSLVNQACLDIQGGAADLVLIGGAEAWRTRTTAQAAGVELGWTVQDATVPRARVAGEDLAMSSPLEQARGVVMPVQVYPLFEQAFRRRLGRSLEQHLLAVCELWARFSQVAARNPHAWARRALTAEQVRDPGGGNRWIGFPYTKVMNSNNAVEQSAALLLSSAERAEALGVPRDRWVFPHSGADANERLWFTERWDLGSSPALRAAGRAALGMAGVGVDEIAHVDLYSCFPSAVNIAAAELGLSTDRPLTVTGGLSFAGGPWNNYVTHSIATMAAALRESPGSVGLISAVGGLMTKHAFGVYSAEPPPDGLFRHAGPDELVEAGPARAVCPEPDAIAEIETWTVMHDRAGAPETGILTCLLPDGSRALATTARSETLAALLSRDATGEAVKLRPDGSAELS